MLFAAPVIIVVCYHNDVWSTFWLVSLFSKISLCIKLHVGRVVLVREFNRQPVGANDNFGLQVIYQTREAVLNHSSSLKAGIEDVTHHLS